ncbi:MAG: hypothetical protein WD016_05825 [Balneolaceae bacterium]
MKKSSWFLFAWIAFFHGCESKKFSSYYENTDSDWKSYMERISDTKDSSLKNTILLVLKSTECSPALGELRWWDEYQSTNSDLNIQLIIIEKYASTFQAFLNQEEITIPASRDSAGILFDLALLPTTPMKVLIDGEGKIKKLAAIGAAIDPTQDTFVGSLKE